jgi:hypothetical protein
MNVAKSPQFASLMPRWLMYNGITGPLVEAVQEVIHKKRIT